MDQYHKLILSGILKSAPFCFSEKITLSNKSIQMYASVACILRINCDQHNRCSSYPHIVKNPLDLINFLCGENLEILFIRRTDRVNDKWSGHVAFPGGQLDLNESDFDAVVREVKEEIGLDISNSTLFYWLGRLPCQKLRKRGKPLIVIPHVFIQLSLIDEQVAINRDEVAAAWWVKVDIFSEIFRMSDSLSITHNIAFNSRRKNPKSTTSDIDQLNSIFKKNYLTVDISHFIIRAIGKGVLQQLVTVFFCNCGIKTVHFLCVPLPLPPNYTALDLQAENASASSSSPPLPWDWKVWGMTLSVTHDLLSVGMLLQQSNKILSPCILFWMDNYYISYLIHMLYKSSKLYYHVVALVQLYKYYLVLFPVLVLIFLIIIL